MSDIMTKSVSHARELTYLANKTGSNMLVYIVITMFVDLSVSLFVSLSFCFFLCASVSLSLFVHFLSRLICVWDV